MVTQRRHESPAVGAAVRRMVRALVVRAGEGDTEALEQLAELEGFTRDATTAAVVVAHDTAGYSFTELGRVLGITRQAARQRVSSAADLANRLPQLFP